MGLDSFLTMFEWKDAERLATLCRFIVLTRPGYRRDENAPIFDWLADSRRNFTFLELRQVDISSEELRRRLLNQESITGLVPPRVEQYIKINKLYETKAVDSDD